MKYFLLPPPLLPSRSNWIWKCESKKKDTNKAYSLHTFIYNIGSKLKVLGEGRGVKPKINCFAAVLNAYVNYLTSNKRSPWLCLEHVYVCSASKLHVSSIYKHVLFLFLLDLTILLRMIIFILYISLTFLLLIQYVSIPEFFIIIKSLIGKLRYTCMFLYN